MKFDQDLCLNLRYDFGKMNSTLGSVVPLAMFDSTDEQMCFADAADKLIDYSCLCNYYLKMRILHLISQSLMSAIKATRKH